eukprot:677424_1
MRSRVFFYFVFVLMTFSMVKAPASTECKEGKKACTIDGTSGVDSCKQSCADNYVCKDEKCNPPAQDTTYHFAHMAFEIDNLMADYDYDLAVEQARETRAIHKLKAEKKEILRAKSRLMRH